MIFLLPLISGTKAGRCSPHLCKACARTVQHTRAGSMRSVPCWGCMMLQCTKLNLIQGEKGYTLYSESSHNMLLRRTIIRTQHLVEGGTQLLFFSSLSKTAALILSWHNFLISDAAILSFQWGKPKVWHYKWHQLSFSSVRSLDCFWIYNCSHRDGEIKLEQKATIQRQCLFTPTEFVQQKGFSIQADAEHRNPALCIWTRAGKMS